MKSITPIAALPEELLLSIFELSDASPPSILKSRHEPNLSLTLSETHTYKDISCVSREWRRIVLPLLFRYTRLRLDVAPRPEWKRCPVCGEDAPGFAPSILSPSSYHDSLFQSANNRAEGADLIDPSDPQNRMREESLSWAGRIHHAVQDYLEMIQEYRLASSILSTVIYTDRMEVGMRDRFPHKFARERDRRYQAAAAMWQLIFATTCPSRVVILAAPVDLAWLSNCAIDLFGDWAFTDMAFHSLELSIQGESPPSRKLHRPVSSSDLRFTPDAYPSIADSSVLYMAQWTHIGLNEGSFLKAYGTYEYFERGPPSLIASIQHCLRRALVDPRKPAGLSAVRSFTYTAIFPFAQHLDVRAFLPQLEELDVQLAPDPESGILNDKERIGKAELQDCWHECFTAYRLITRPFRTFSIGPDWTPKLKRFVCQDVRIPLALEDLDEAFTPLCLPVWAEKERGVFIRLVEMPEHVYQ